MTKDRVKPTCSECGAPANFFRYRETQWRYSYPAHNDGASKKIKVQCKAGCCNRVSTSNLHKCAKHGAHYVAKDGSTQTIKCNYGGSYNSRPKQ